MQRNEVSTLELDTRMVKQRRPVYIPLRCDRFERITTGRALQQEGKGRDIMGLVEAQRKVEAREERARGRTVVTDRRRESSRSNCGDESNYRELEVERIEVQRDRGLLLNRRREEALKVCVERTRLRERDGYASIRVRVFCK
ncbi:hypothetical protein F2Q69_00053935 [Brassica cretica]|uniref:Uncharacterized protein n=1 Tax=Brassica cretica TaxID=69181 RepID=A0A8S9N1Y5_BRACR|nr:hypothetical protein F2Q69_00053935 [Brassica cretica]